MRELEILRGVESFFPDGIEPRRPWTRTPSPPPQAAPPVRPPAGDETIPASRAAYADVYSGRHERLLLRLDHIVKMDAIRRSFNRNRTHPGQRALTTSDIVNAVLDFAFEHPIPFHELVDADQVQDVVSKSVYRSVLSRWRQFNENFD